MRNGRKNCKTTYDNSRRTGRYRNRIEILLIILALSCATVEAAGEKPVNLPTTDEIVIEYEEDEISFSNDMDYYRFLIRIGAEVHHVDPILAISISRLETGNWQNIDKHHNFGGLTIGGVVQTYERESDGLDAYMNCLEWYRDNGMTTIDSMAHTYCENDEWAKLVKIIYEEERNYEITY